MIEIQVRLHKDFGLIVNRGMLNKKAKDIVFFICFVQKYDEKANILESKYYI